MKNSSYLFLYLLSFLFISCEEKIIDLVINIDDTFNYSVSNEGLFDDSYTVNKEDIIDDDLELDSITDVNIQSLALQITPATGNESTRIRLSTVYSDINYPGGIFINEDLIIDIAEYSTLKLLSSYNSTGINALAEKIRDYINGNDLSSFTVRITGNSIDNTGKVTDDDIILDIIIKLNASAVFSEKVELPDI